MALIITSCMTFENLCNLFEAQISYLSKKGLDKNQWFLIFCVCVCGKVGVKDRFKTLMRKKKKDFDEKVFSKQAHRGTWFCTEVLRGSDFCKQCIPETSALDASLWKTPVPRSHTDRNRNSKSKVWSRDLYVLHTFQGASHPQQSLRATWVTMNVSWVLSSLGTNCRKFRLWINWQYKLKWKPLI